MAVDYTIDKANAEQDAWVNPATLTDPVAYSTEESARVTAKFFGQPMMEELLALIDSRVSSKTYNRTYTCIAGDAVGDPVYLSADDTVAKALATTQAKARVVGFIRSKPTTTSCLLEHFRYVAGLAGLVAGQDLFLSDAGAAAGTPGTIRVVIGVALTASTGIIYASPVAGNTQTVLRNYISGFQLANNGTDSVDVGVGQGADASNSAMIELAALMTKDLSSAWASGTGNGGLFTGSEAADTWYHVFVIRNPTTHAVDAGFHTAIDPTANIPAGYTQYRRVGSILTDATPDIIGFEQKDGWFTFKDSSALGLDVNVSNVGATEETFTLSTPLGVWSIANIAIQHNDPNGISQIYVHNTVADDEAGRDDAMPLIMQRNPDPNLNAYMTLAILVDESSQINLRSNDPGSNSNTIIRIGVFSYFDFRGRN